MSNNEHQTIGERMDKLHAFWSRKRQPEIEEDIGLAKRLNAHIKKTPDNVQRSPYPKGLEAEDLRTLDTTQF